MRRMCGCWKTDGYAVKRVRDAAETARGTAETVRNAVERRMSVVRIFEYLFMQRAFVVGILLAAVIPCVGMVVVKEKAGRAAP